jgi:signal transduction histidine kinase
MERATVEFQNFGVGILRGELEAVKEKFYRGQLAVKEGRAGTGRGLWSADLFFRGAGGGVVVSSEYKGHKAEEGGGPYFTCVQAWIPCKIGAEVANG